MCMICIEETVASIGVASMLWPKLRSLIFNFVMRLKTKKVLRISCQPLNHVPTWVR